MVSNGFRLAILELVLLSFAWNMYIDDVMIPREKTKRTKIEKLRDSPIGAYEENLLREALDPDLIEKLTDNREMHPILYGNELYHEHYYARCSALRIMSTTRAVLKMRDETDRLKKFVKANVCDSESVENLVILGEYDFLEKIYRSDEDYPEQPLLKEFSAGGSSYVFGKMVGYYVENGAISRIENFLDEDKKQNKTNSFALIMYKLGDLKTDKTENIIEKYLRDDDNYIKNVAIMAASLTANENLATTLVNMLPRKYYHVPSNKTDHIKGIDSKIFFAIRDICRNVSNAKNMRGYTPFYSLSDRKCGYEENHYSLSLQQWVPWSKTIIR